MSNKYFFGLKEKRGSLGNPLKFNLRIFTLIYGENIRQMADGMIGKYDYAKYRWWFWVKPDKLDWRHVGINR